MKDRDQIREEVAEIIAETIEELSLMTMAYADNRMIVDDPTVPITGKIADRYTPFHKDFYQNTRGE